MKEFPPELIYVLIFVGMFLVQYMLKRRRSQASQDAPVPQPPDETTPDFAGLEWGTPMGGSPSRASGDELGRPEAPDALRVRPRPRFSRQSLMGTPRDVQNAVVIATIMGPCRALEPPGDTAVAPRRAAL